MAEQTHLKNATSPSQRRLVAGVRVGLAGAGLFAIFVDPTEPDRYVETTYAALVAYVTFSIVVYLVNRLGRPHLPAFVVNPTWVDLGWYFVLVSLSSGTNSIFFFFFYFVILNAAFSHGTKTGLRITIAAAAGFASIGYLTAVGDGQQQFDRSLLRPMSLLILGYLISIWGGNQLTALRRLDLLKDLANLANPRFGTDRTMATALARLRDFFGADTCLYIPANRRPDEAVSVMSGGLEGGPELSPVVLDAHLTAALSKIEPEHSAAYGQGRVIGIIPFVRLHAADTATGAPVDLDRDQMRVIAEHLDAGSFLTSPVVNRGAYSGRIILSSRSAQVFHARDISFLLEAIDCFAPVIENIRLVDRWASDAANNERQRIARDVHDSVIQPYIGIQMGIDALAQAIGDASSAEAPGAVEALRSRTAKLREMAGRGIEDLRKYTRELREGRHIEASLVPSLERYAERFADATGIEVTIERSGEVPIMDRLAAELFQLAVEGLSNIRRHTSSQRAAITIEFSRDQVLLSILNTDGAAGAVPFVPASIAERTAALGGSVGVDHLDGQTRVRVNIPL